MFEWSTDVISAEDLVGISGDLVSAGFVLEKEHRKESFQEYTKQPGSFLKICIT
jgi:hypothetical protein